MLARGKGLERHANRLALRGAVGEIKTPIMLRAFDEFAFHETFGQVSAGMRAESIGSIKPALLGAVNGVSPSLVVEPNHVRRLEKPADADLDPPVHYPAFGGENTGPGWRIGAEDGCGRFTFDVVSGVFHLA